MKKYIAIFASMLLFITTVTGTAFAQTNSADTGNEAKFQAIRDILNKEYGTNVRPATDQELKLVGLSKADIQKNLNAVSAAEYETELRKTIEREMEISKEALAKAKKAGISEKDFKPVTPPNADK